MVHGKTFSVEAFSSMLIVLWDRDTVSSVGVARGPNLPETASGMSHVCAFRHALALDERRVKFSPEYADGGSGPSKEAGNVKEVWFAGTHSDM